MVGCDVVCAGNGHEGDDCGADGEEDGEPREDGG